MGLVGKWGVWWQPPEPLGLSEGPGGLQDPTEGGPTVLWAEVGQNKEKTHLLFKFLYAECVHAPRFALKLE